MAPLLQAESSLIHVYEIADEGGQILLVTKRRSLSERPPFESVLKAAVAGRTMLQLHGAVVSRAFGRLVVVAEEKGSQWVHVGVAVLANAPVRLVGAVPEPQVVLCLVGVVPRLQFKELECTTAGAYVTYEPAEHTGQLVTRRWPCEFVVGLEIYCSHVRCRREQLLFRG